MCVHVWVVGRAGVLPGGLWGGVRVRESGRAEGPGWTRGVGEGTSGAWPSDSSPTPAAVGPCVRAELKGGGASGSLSSPRRHLCLPVTHYAGSEQQMGAEVWLRETTGPGPPTQAAVTACPAPLPSPGRHSPSPGPVGFPESPLSFAT